VAFNLFGTTDNLADWSSALAFVSVSEFPPAEAELLVGLFFVGSPARLATLADLAGFVMPDLLFAMCASGSFSDG
jgi:hypothetical protein